MKTNGNKNKKRKPHIIINYDLTSYCKHMGFRITPKLTAFIDNLAKEANVKRSDAEKFIAVLLQN
jgi:hypothetical protein